MQEPQDWVGLSRCMTDPMDAWAARALVATLELDRDIGPEGALPPFWHWLYFRDAAPRSALGPDGHPATGGFMPAARQPRRMWAGGRVWFHAPLALGRKAEKRETIAAIRETTGRSGPMTFVTVRHEVSQGGAISVVEEQDIVYREDPAPGAARPDPKLAPADETQARAWVCDSTVLFRYSALTFNGHKIHYDLAHAREVEGYPGLVVHGPLLATLLLELAGEMAGGGPITEMAFRAMAPIFADERFEACGRADGPGRLLLWIRGADGRLAMQMEAGLGTWS